MVTIFEEGSPSPFGAKFPLLSCIVPSVPNIKICLHLLQYIVEIIAFTTSLELLAELSRRTTAVPVDEDIFSVKVSEYGTNCLRALKSSHSIRQNICTKFSRRVALTERWGITTVLELVSTNSVQIIQEGVVYSTSQKSFIIYQKYRGPRISMKNLPPTLKLQIGSSRHFYTSVNKETPVN